MRTKKKDLKIKPIVIAEDGFAVDKFTIIKLVDQTTGKYGVGISRRSTYDKADNDIGYRIARGRAYKALQLKVNGYPVNHQYMS